MSPFNVAELAQAQGWEPDQVRSILEQYQIPKKSSDRTQEQWQQLERLLLRTPSEPVPSVGDRVRLKNTSQQYTVLEIFEVECGQPPPERWARLVDDSEGVAHWKINQLEVRNDLTVNAFSMRDK